MAVLAIIATAVGIRLTDYRKNSNSISTTPGDTRLLSYSPTFCEGISLSSPANYTASLYLLTEEPKLSSQNHLLVDTEQSGGLHIAPVEHHSWHFHFHPDSQLLVKACAIVICSDGASHLDAEKAVQFLIIRGEKNFHWWKKNGDDRAVSERSNVPSQCLEPLTGTKHVLHYEEEFYFVFVNSSPCKAVVSAMLDFSRTQYTFSKSNVHSHCRTETERYGRANWGCSLSVPRGSNFYTVAIMNSSSSSSGSNSTAYSSEAFTADWICQPRATFYAILGGVVPAVVIVSAVVFVVAGLILWSWRRRRRLRQVLLSRMRNGNTSEETGLYGSCRESKSHIQ